MGFRIEAKDREQPGLYFSASMSFRRKLQDDHGTLALISCGSTPFHFLFHDGSNKVEPDPCSFLIGFCGYIGLKNMGEQVAIDATAVVFDFHQSILWVQVDCDMSVRTVFLFL